MKKHQANQKVGRNTMALLLIVASVFVWTAAQAASPTYLSPIELDTSPDGNTLYVAQKTARQIGVLDLKTRKPKGVIAVPGKPSGVKISPDGKTLYVTLYEEHGIVLKIAVPSGKVLAKLRVGHSPIAPEISPDGAKLYICNRFNNYISIIDTGSMKEIGRVNVHREPVACVITKDGRYLYVANHLPTGAANVERMTSVIDIIDTQSKKVAKAIHLPNGAIDLRGICIGPQGKTVYVPSIFARFLVPTSQIERGWINTHALNLIDVASQKLIYTVLLDDVDLGAANPWGVCVSADNKYICVAHSATHELSVIDRKRLMDKLHKLPPNDGTPAYEASRKNPANNLSFLSGIRQRVKLKGIGPRGITPVGNKIYIAQYFTDDIGLVDVSQPFDDLFAKAISMGPKKKMGIVRTGEMYFNDACICFQQWQTCSTCHPDGRTDAVNWDLLNDGIGNPKSTKSLLLSHKLPPVMITGVRAKAEVAVRAGIRFIQFAQVQEDRAKAIDEYLKSLTPMRSPHLVNGKLSAKALRGKAIFKKAGCSSCHPPDHYFTDQEKYDVGTGDGMEKGREFDTPTLIEVWRTAPYLYDGRAKTIQEIFTKFNKDDEHGETSKLSKDELDALAEYVLSQ